MHNMNAYIPPPSLGGPHPLSRGDCEQDNADDAPLVPPSNFFSLTLSTSTSLPPSSSNYIPPSNSLMLFNQPGSFHPGPIVHFHTPLQNTIFPSVSQSLPLSPLPPPAFIRDIPLHLGLPDSAAPVRQ